MRTFGILASATCLAVTITIFVSCFIQHINFKQNCSGYLKRAADANTIELAAEQLQISLKYLEDKNLTSGKTNIFYYTPNCDIGFWYTNLKESHKELVNLPKSADNLTVSNQLMKLRETILDDHGEGYAITSPPNIEYYPNQVTWCILQWLAALTSVGTLIFVFVAIEGN